MNSQPSQLSESRTKKTALGETMIAVAVMVVVVLTLGLFVALLRLDSSFVMFVVMAMTAVAAVVIGIVSVIGARQQRGRFAEDHDQAGRALAGGDLARARTILEEWAENGSVPSIEALARHDLAWTLMRQGDVRRAAAVAARNWRRHETVLAALGLATTSAAQLALYHALLGELEAAESWMAEVGRHAGDRDVPLVAGQKAFARGVMDCRAGHCGEAAHWLDEHWAEYEASLPRESLRSLRVVLAFAVAAVGPRDAGVAGSALALARPAYPGEYDFLAGAWPEMAAFLATHETR